jgi:hypothetical protein
MRLNTIVCTSFIDLFVQGAPSKPASGGKPAFGGSKGGFGGNKAKKAKPQRPGKMRRKAAKRK